jgi:hypothetical protein
MNQYILKTFDHSGYELRSVIINANNRSEALIHGTIYRLQKAVNRVSCKQVKN